MQTSWEWYGVKCALNSCKVGPLCPILVPALLHDVVYHIGTSVWCVHPVAAVNMRGNIFNRLIRGEEERRGKEGGRGRRDRGREEGRGRRDRGRGGGERVGGGGGGGG